MGQGAKRETMQMRQIAAAVAAMVLAATVTACAKKTPPVAKPINPQPVAGGSTRPPAPPEPVAEPQPVPPEPPPADTLDSRDIDDINKNSPFQPVFYSYDSSDVEGPG